MKRLLLIGLLLTGSLQAQAPGLTFDMINDTVIMPCHKEADSLKIQVVQLTNDNTRLRTENAKLSAELAHLKAPVSGPLPPEK